jgi:subfamily B ATP-binding cassette protein HlyB/CyaB
MATGLIIISSNLIRKLGEQRLMQQEKPPVSQLSNTDFVWLLASLCQLHHIPFDAELLSRQNPPPHTLTQLFKALSDMGLKTHTASIDARSCKRMALPFIAFEKTASIEPHPVLVTLVLIVHSDGERVLYFPAGTDQSHSVPIDKFLARYESDVITIEKAIPEPAEEGADLNPGLKRQPFGFK